MENVLVGLPRSLSCTSHMPHSAAGLCLSSPPTAALATSQHPLSRARVSVWSEGALWGLETPARKGFIPPALFVFNGIPESVSHHPPW